VAGVTRFFHRLWVIVAAVRDCPGVVFEVCGGNPVALFTAWLRTGPVCPFRPDCPGGTGARPMITERKQPISCGISMKTEILRDLAAPRRTGAVADRARPSCSPRATKSSALA
jgi:hypothetical protein